MPPLDPSEYAILPFCGAENAAWADGAHAIAARSAPVTSHLEVRPLIGAPWSARTRADPISWEEVVQPLVSFCGLVIYGTKMP